MENRGDNGGVAVVVAVVLILLLLAGGGGAYYLVTRQHTALAVEAERALVAEAMVASERAHAEALLKTDKDHATDQTPAVESILHAQVAAWNQGDINRFMAHYWNSDDLTFSSEGKTTRGWTATMARYKERYPTKEKLGHLKLTDLEITPLGDSAALVLGKWNVEREGGPLTGTFSLVVRKFDNRWLIVHDHTSRMKD